MPRHTLASRSRRRPLLPLLFALILAAGTALTPLPAAAEPGYDLDEVIASARLRNPALGGNQARVDAAIAARERRIGAYGPKLVLDANVRVWDDALTFGLGGGSGAPQLPPPTTPYEEVIAGLMAGFGEPTTVRDQVTADITVSLVQPLTPLINLSDGLDALDTQIELSEIANARLERQVVRQASEAYFRTLQAESLLVVRQDSVARLSAELEDLDALIAARVASEHDRLRLEVARAAAEQALIRARSDVELARSALALAMGLSPGEPVAAQPPRTLAAPPPAPSLEEAYALALEHRLELSELRGQERLAEVGIEDAELAMWPSLNAMAAYTHSEGQGLSGADSFFAGLTLNWVLWEWGATWYGIDQAEAQLEIVRSQRISLERQLRLQVESAWYELKATVDSLAVAALAEGQAADAYELERMRYDSGLSTTTELLAAESAVTEARINYQAALYEALVDYVALIDTLGLELSESRILP